MTDPSAGKNRSAHVGRLPLFRVSNNHTPQCGEPPQIDADAEDCYHGYFENESGEQAIFVYDRRTGNAMLWMGDAGWEKPYTVVAGRVPGLILGPSEALWLHACWRAATDGRGT